MKKGLFLFIFVLCLNASEFEYGKGKFNIEFNLLGLTNDHNEKIKIFTMLQRHKNIFASKWFYSYKISWFKSDTIKTVVNTYNSNINNINNTLLTKTLSVNTTILNSSSQISTSNASNNLSQAQNSNLSADINSTQLPSIVNLSNKIRGLDINIILGRDLLNKNIYDTYIGIGVITGITLPYIKTSSDSSNNYLKKSKTKITTYKIGGFINIAYLINPFLQLYGDLAYSYQTAKIKNNELNINFKSSGNNFFYDLGIKFQLKTVKNFGWIKLMPKLFLTFGWRCNYWNVNSVNINSQSLFIDNYAKLSFTISQIYMGLGYDF